MNSGVDITRNAKEHTKSFHNEPDLISERKPKVCSNQANI
jgi:hypothetical protein